MVFQIVSKNIGTDNCVLKSASNNSGTKSLQKPFFRSVKGYVADKKQVGNICRTCCRAVLNDKFTDLYDVKNRKYSEKLRKILSEINPEIDLELYKNPIICKKCVEMLFTSYEFKTKCGDTEAKLNGFLAQRKEVKKAEVSLLILVESSTDGDYAPKQNTSLSFEQSEVRVHSSVGTPEISSVFKTKKKFSYSVQRDEKEYAQLVKPTLPVFSGAILCEKCGLVIDSEEGATYRCVHCNYICRNTTLKKLKVKRQNLTLDCKDCGEMFKNRKKLKLHLKNTHTDGFNLCYVCGKSFKFNFLLQIHFLKHENGTERKLTCDKCESRFLDKEKYLRHVMPCYRKFNKKYRCNICLVSFWKKENFFKHQTSVHRRGKRRNCNSCEIRFFTQTDYVKHLMNYHFSKNEKEVVFKDEPHCEMYKEGFCQKGALSNLKQDIHPTGSSVLRTLLEGKLKKEQR